MEYMFSALRHRNYRLYFTGQSISLIGTWMQRTAMSWLVYRMTHSPFLLGAIGFTDQISSFFLTSLTGVLIDRWELRRILMVTQVLALIQALILALLVLTSTVAPWHLLFLSLLLGLINSFDMPARQSFVVEMVEDREDLGNAIALNSSIVHVARTLGPFLAGALIAVAGEGMCFLLNAMSYVAVILSLCFMKLTFKRDYFKGEVLQGLKEGVVYAFNFAPIREILLLLALTSLAGMPFLVLMPVFAKDVFHGGPHTLGFLMGAPAVGALIGAVWLASRKSVLGLGRMIAAASMIFGIGLIAFSYSHVFWFSLALLVLSGFGRMVHIASSNTIIQTIVDDDKRGRVMSLYTMAFMGMVPFGSLVQGSLADKIGAPPVVLMGGMCCLAGSVLFAVKLPSLEKILRPIYGRMGGASEP
jgi:MFS family permease